TEIAGGVRPPARWSSSLVGGVAKPLQSGPRSVSTEEPRSHVIQSPTSESLSPRGGERPERIDPVTRRVSLDASNPAFFQDPYAAFERIRAVAPVFFWEELGMWCLTQYGAVNGVFR